MEAPDVQAGKVRRTGHVRRRQEAKKTEFRLVVIPVLGDGEVRSNLSLGAGLL